jgi:hypothetical protein
LILKRCPSCRGVCDVERGGRCFACGAPISPEAPALKRKRPPKAYRIVAKDKKMSTGLLVTFAIVGGLGVLGIIASEKSDPVLRVVLGVPFFAAVVLGFRALLRKDAGTLSQGVLRLFAFFGILIVGGIALVAGLLLLLFIACTFKGV